VRAAAGRFPFQAMPTRDKFVPFDPAAKMAEASVTDGQGVKRRVVKGAFAYVMAAARNSDEATAKALELEEKGYRVLAVAVGASAAIDVVGLLAMSDPPRPEAELYRQAEVDGRANCDGDRRRAGDSGGRCSRNRPRWPGGYGRTDHRCRAA